MIWILFVTFVAFGDQSVSVPMQHEFVMANEAACVSKMNEYNSGKYTMDPKTPRAYGLYSAQCIPTPVGRTAH